MDNYMLDWYKQIIDYSIKMDDSKLACYYV